MAPILRVGDIIGTRKRYRIVRSLGPSGYGQYFEGSNIFEGVTRHVKVSRHSGTILNEQEIYSIIGDASCAPTLHDFDVSVPRPWLALSVEGHSLYQILNKAPGKCLSKKQVLSVGFHGINALRELHTIGIVHADIKLHSMCISRSADKNPIILLNFDYSFNAVLPAGTRAYQKAPFVKNNVMSSTRVRRGLPQKELDDLHSFAYVLLRLRSLWDLSLAEKEADDVREKLATSLDEFLGEDNKFLAGPLRAIFSMPYNQELPDYGAILAAFRNSDCFDEDAWKELK